MRENKPIIVGVVLCLTLGLLSGYSVSTAETTWYQALIKPSFNPPAAIFGPVWTVLYIMIGIIFGLLYQKDRLKSVTSLIFLVQFMLNLSWSPLFFYVERVDLALINIVIMWCCLLVFLIRSRDDKTLFWLCLPYSLWVSFALVLNATILSLNASSLQSFMPNFGLH